MRAEWGDLDRLQDLASTLAGAWGARARASTTPGQERAMLRLFGVHGLDADGRPLAGEVVDRYVADDPVRLAGGVALPFAMALLEYDLVPQQLALDVASGAVDLALEAELLREPDRRSVAEQEARRLTTAAIERIDANRTASRELVGLLGDAPRPWIGTNLLEPAIDRAIPEAIRRVDEGIDLLRVYVPVSRELITRMSSAGVEPHETPSYEARFSIATDRTEEDAVPPVGSQRGLADLRSALDELAAGQQRYVRLATAAPALAAPEQSVVAAFERVDVVEADAMAEIVAGDIDPDRALADHAFAHRVLARAGSVLLVGAGPLVVAPDLARGVPSDPATRAGRALALQLVGVTLALADGLPAEQIILGALPGWLTEEASPAARALAEVALRRRLLPDHALCFEEPVVSPELASAWPFLLAAAVPLDSPTALVLRTPRTVRLGDAVSSARTAYRVAGEIGEALGERHLQGVAREHARAVVAAAIVTLEQLHDVGWRSMVGEGAAGGEALRLGSRAVTERNERLDLFSAVLETVG